MPKPIIKKLELNQERELAFEVLSRVRYAEGFHEKLEKLLSETESPFTEAKGELGETIRRLK